jgi:oligopeptidase B
MRDVEDPEFLQYLRDENSYGDQFFTAHDETIETIFGEIKSRVQETDMSTPVRNGPWWYVSRTQEGLSYPIHHRGPTRDTADRFVLLDENLEAEGHEYFDLGAFDASHDHRSFAWSMDTAGDERYTLRIRTFPDGGGGRSGDGIGDDGGHESAGRDLDDVIEGVSNAGTAWSQDGTTLFYVRPDDQERPSQVWRHRIGDVNAADDTLVHDEPDERFFVAIGETRSAEWIVIHSASKTSSEVQLAPSDLSADFTIVRPRRDDVDYQVDHWGDRLVMTTNDAAVDFRLLTAPIDGEWTTAEAWAELVSHVPGRRITGADAFAGHLVVHEWADAQPRLRIIFRDNTFPERLVDLGDEPHDVDLSSNPEWNADTIRFVTHSMVTPPTLYEEQVATGERVLLRQAPTPNVDLTQYVTRRLWAPSAGAESGTGDESASVLVPLDIVHHIDTPLDGTAAAVLYGYGSYEASLAPWFSVARLSLLDRGMVFALGHPRGGGELGRTWYLDGKLLAKQRTFDDMLACSEHLVAEQICAHDRLAIRGGSAGGLLVGACMTQRPDLYSSVIAEVPFVDIVSTMSDPSLPLTVTEWEEWGDPRTEPFASAMAAYSPYDNTVAAEYPAVYVSAGLNDPRVSVHEPAKWVARLRDVNASDQPVVMRTEMGAGHGGPTGRYDAWRDEARTLAFLLATT